MSGERLYRDGALHVELEVVARVYSVQSVWLRRAYERGLLGEGLVAEGAVYLRATRLERVATLVRLRHLIGEDLDELAFELTWTTR